MSVTGRHIVLLNLLIATLIAEPHSKAVVVIDIERRFDPTAVLQTLPFMELPPEDDSGNQTERPHVSTSHVTMADLSHIHVYRPSRGSKAQLADLLASAEEYMFYGKHASRAREWWGTILIGEGDPGGGLVDVVGGWKGWLRVDRAEVQGFGIGMSVKEALADRERRQQALDRERRWVASSVWGSFTFIA